MGLADGYWDDKLGLGGALRLRLGTKGEWWLPETTEIRRTRGKRVSQGESLEQPDVAPDVARLGRYKDLRDCGPFEGSLAHKIT